MQYKVNCYFGRGADVPCATFKDIADARLFVEKKLALDAELKVKVTYRIYHLNEMIQEFDPAKELLGTAQSSSSAGGGQGKGSAAAFRPTPFNMAPRPTGSPQRWLVNPDEDDKDKNK